MDCICPQDEGAGAMGEKANEFLKMYHRYIHNITKNKLSLVLILKGLCGVLKAQMKFTLTTSKFSNTFYKIKLQFLKYKPQAPA